MRNLIKRSNKYSRRINYDALKNLFDDTDTAGAENSALLNPPAEVDLDDKEEDMYTIDDKSDGEGIGNIVIEESGGGVGVVPPSAKGKRAVQEDVGDVGGADGEEDGDGDGEEVEMSDRGGDEFGWEEGFEQEV